MKKSMLIRGIEPEVWRRFRAWCESQGIPTAGKNSQIGPTLSRIIEQHIKTDKEPSPQPSGDKVSRLKDILDRNILPKQQPYVPAEYVNAIISKTLHITTPHLIRQYATLCGYTYDKKRKMYNVPITKQNAPSVSCHKCGKDIDTDSIIHIGDNPYDLNCYMALMKKAKTK